MLPRAVASLLPQVDKIIIYAPCCDLSQMPRESDKLEIMRHCVDRGSANRFKAGGLKGYLAYCDDDLEYAPDYIFKLITGVEKYKRKCVVGFHGKTINAPLISYCGTGPGRIEKNYPCLGTVAADVQAHMIGTGAMMYHSDTLQITDLDFLHDNLDDAEFSILCQRLGIPLIVLEHQQGVVKYLNPAGPTIWEDTMRDQRPLLNLINSHQWRLLDVNAKT